MPEARKKVKLARVSPPPNALVCALRLGIRRSLRDPAWPGLGAQRPRHLPDPLSNMDTGDFKCILLNTNVEL